MTYFYTILFFYRVDQQHDVLVIRENMTDFSAGTNMTFIENNTTDTKLNKRSISLESGNATSTFDLPSTTAPNMPNYYTSNIIRNVSTMQTSNMTNYSYEETTTPEMSSITKSKGTISTSKDSLTPNVTTVLIAKMTNYTTEQTDITTPRLSTVKTSEISNFSLPPVVPTLSSVIVTSIPLSTVARILNSTETLTNGSKEINYTAEPLNVLLEKATVKEQTTIRTYSIMIFVTSVLVLIKTYANFDYCRRASVRIHKAMVKSAVNAVMSFYDTHFIGNILNRFSQDLTNIDEVLPWVFGEIVRVRMIQLSSF